MKTIKTSLIVAMLVGLGLSSPALAADTSVTVVSRGTQIPVGITPKVGYLEAVATATGSFTVDAPQPNGKSIAFLQCTTRDTNGNMVPRNVTISNSVITVASATGQASGTLAVNDVLKCNFDY